MLKSIGSIRGRGRDSGLTVIVSALGLSVICSALVACDDVSCPGGTMEVNGHCIETEGSANQGESAGVAGDGAGATEQPGASGLGGSSSTPSATSSGVAGSGVAGSGVAGSGVAGSGVAGSGGGVSGSFGGGTTAGRGSSTAGTSGVSSPGSGGAAAASSSAGSSSPSAAAAGGSAAPPTAAGGACAGHANEAICEGAVMQHCGPDEMSTSPENCASAMLCQVGLSSGSCAACNPGSFRCTGTELEACSDAGQYGHFDTCASAALCKESAGMCTDMVCNPNVKSCAADGTLQTCNADGSGFVGAGEACGRDMCDARALRCLKCVPSPNTCSGNTVTGCSSDGQTQTRTTCSGALPQCADGRCVACLTANDCTSRDECIAPACNAATHTCGAGTPKPAKTICSGGKACDGAGTCTTCGNNADDAGESCEFGGSFIYAAGTCDPKTCKLTDTAYQRCSMAVDNGPTNCPVNAPLWFCAPHGACSVGCSVDADCKTTAGKGTCLPFSGRAYCVITGAEGCPSGLGPVDVKGLGIDQPLCGTVPRPAMAAP
jgi:hypothetical protein